jgi:acyl-CoA reductase-like NAD-dependent aldehyde dehydrogenase
MIRPTARFIDDFLTQRADAQSLPKRSPFDGSVMALIADADAAQIDASAQDVLPREFVCVRYPELVSVSADFA